MLLFFGGITPARLKKTGTTDLAVPVFNTVANDYLAIKTPVWPEKHGKTVARWLELYILPFIGDRPITEITPPPAKEMTARQLAQWARQLMVTAAAYKEQLEAVRGWFMDIDGLLTIKMPGVENSRRCCWLL